MNRRAPVLESLLSRSRPKSHRLFAFRIGFQFVAALSGMAIGGLTARWLGPEGKGVLALLLLIGHIVSTLASLGMNDATPFLVHRRGVPLGQFVRAIPYHFVVVGFPISMLLALVLAKRGWGLWSLDPTTLILVYVVGRVLTRLVVLQGRGILRAEERYDAVMAVDAVEVIAPLAFLLVLRFALSPSVGSTLLSFFLATLAAAMIAYGLISSRRGPALTIGDWWLHLKRTASYGSSVLARFTGTIAVQRVNFFVIAAMMGNVELGLYSVATAVVDVLLRIPDAASWILIPLTAKKGDKDAHAATVNYARAVVALTLVGALVFAVFGREIVVAVFSRNFEAAMPALRPLLAGAVILAYATVVESSLLGRGAAREVAVATWVGGATTLIGDLILIPGHGLFGAGLAACGGYSVTAFILTHTYRKCRELQRAQ
jgi:O-antigen/teichoic acid export membrane protein